ncbi:uncharacterized protein JCM10292_006196 [Rhodotorula paludigena]|uniref:uncharacterized protein n=1 Tax=Rhodotorula paludigena TaxID=86838 RepID=UPI00316C1F4C
MSAPAESASAEATDGPVDAQEQPPRWHSAYTSFSTSPHLPDAIASRLPSADTLSAAQSRITDLATSGTKQAGQMSRTASQRVAELRQSAGGKMGNWAECAWSVTNQTQVPLNVSLNQVGPLYYEVLPPEATFERRVPNLWFSLEVRPYTSPSTAYNKWSTTWPILCVAGPTVAVTSLLALPFVAAAAGGTALASLSAFGSSIASGAAGATETVTASAGAAAAFAAKASRVPGAGRVKSKLADAAKKFVGEQTSRENVQRHVVRYLQRGGAGAGAGGAATGAQAIEASEEEQAQASVEGAESKQSKQRRAKKEKKIEEVDVTGFELEKVLRRETNDSAVDKALAKAFKRLSFKTKLTEYRTQDKPVLRVVGGPELETRTPAPTFFHPHPSPRQFLVFYPFVLLHTPQVVAEPVPVDEVPPTEDERRVMSDAKVVASYEEAEKASEKAPTEGAGPANEANAVKAERAVREAEVEAAQAEGSPANQAPADEEKPVKGAKEKKKGWIW